MANKHKDLASLFTDIADAIREKMGNIATIVADDFPDVIRNIQTGVNTFDATATAADITINKTAYVNGEKIIGTLITQSYYTGTSDPDNSLGEDGDLYLVKG